MSANIVCSFGLLLAIVRRNTSRVPQNEDELMPRSNLCLNNTTALIGCAFFRECIKFTNSIFDGESL